MIREAPSREATITEIARSLPQRNGQLGRLLWRHARGRLHRGMASVLAALDDGPRSISELAEREGLAQPTLTRMVERLEAAALVRRERSAPDGRVVVVTRTPAGAAEIEGLRSRYLAVLDERLSGLTDVQLGELRAASEALVVLIDALRDEG